MVLTKAMSNTKNPVKSTSLVQESKDQSRPTVQTWEDKSFYRSQDLGLCLQLAGRTSTTVQPEDDDVRPGVQDSTELSRACNKENTVSNIIKNNPKGSSNLPSKDDETTGCG